MLEHEPATLAQQQRMQAEHFSGALGIREALRNACERVNGQDGTRRGKDGAEGGQQATTIEVRHRHVSSSP
jgi:hypothetical protein